MKESIKKGRQQSIRSHRKGWINRTRQKDWD